MKKNGKKKCKGCQNTAQGLKCPNCKSEWCSQECFEKNCKNHKFSCAKTLEEKKNEYDKICKQGRVLFEKGDYKCSIETFERALGSEDYPTLKYWFAHVLRNIGSCYYSLGEYKKSLQYHEDSLKIEIEIGSKSGEATSLENLGNSLFSLGEYKKSFQCHEDSLKIHKEIGCKSGEAGSLNNLGNCYFSLGEYKKSIPYHEDSLKIHKEIGCKSGEADSLNNLGSCYFSLGEYKKSLQYYEASLKIQKEIGSKSGEATSLNNFGSYYFSLGEYKKSFQYHEDSLKIEKEIGSKSGEATSLNNLGNCYFSLGEYEESIPYHEDSLKIHKKIGSKSGEAISLGNLGNCYCSLGEFTKSLQFYEDSLEIQKEIGSKLGEADSLRNLGKYFFSREEHGKSIQYHQDSLKILKHLQAKLLEMEQHSELGTAYSKDSQISNARDSFLKFHEIYKQKQNEFTTEHFYVAFKERYKKGIKHYLKFLIELKEYKEALNLVNDRDECINNHYKGISVIYYIIDDDSIGIWILKGREFLHFENVNGKDLIPYFESFGSNMSAFSIRCSQMLFEDNDDSTDRFGKSKFQKNEKTRIEKLSILENCYKMLIDPIKEYLPLDEVFYIVPHQSISMLPFSAFINEKTEKYFIEEYTFAFSDSFENIDLHFESFDKLNNNSKCLFVSNPTNKEPSLINATKEVKEIGEMIKYDSIIVLDGKDAKKSDIMNVLNSKECQPPIFHVAAHTSSSSTKNSNYQEEYAFRGSIECESDENGETIKLYSYEILDLDFSNCELVVLNTCESGHGKITNDGILGLNLSFSKSGASTVICSLWKINDSSAKSLMVSFYKCLKDGKSKIESLREASLNEMKKDRNAIDNWAPLILFGHHGEFKSKFIFKNDQQNDSGKK